MQGFRPAGMGEGHASMTGQIAADGARRGRRRVLRSIAGVLVVLSAVVLAGAAVLWLLLPDFDDAAPGSLGWYQMPGFATAAPTPAACGEPRYALHSIDGEKPQNAIVRFQTRASLAQLRTAYAGVLAVCQPDPRAPGSDRYECDNSRGYHTVLLSLDPGPDGQCRAARIAFLSG
jgi:hypothetical protein